MGLIKEYVDRAVQTDTENVPSPYTDPAVILAAPPAIRQRLAQDVHTASPSASDSAHAILQSPTSPMLAPLVSRRLSKRRHIRCPAGEIVNRRIVSMPENKSEIISRVHGKRVVSMPDRVPPVLEPSAELFYSPSAAAGDSFGSYGERHERVHVFSATSDIPQTPSPPSSPESLLIIASGTQLPEGFLRRKYSPEPLIEEDEDWIGWANSPPRPIPALHGPLSLPYARCPSGAEGTIIEEPENVAQMIWGLSPDDQLHGQVRTEGLSSLLDNPQIAPSHGSSQVLPRLQKKRTPANHQIPKLSRTQVSSQTTRAKQSLARTQQQGHDEKRIPPSQFSPDIKPHQDIVGGPPWSEGQSTPTNVSAPDNLGIDVDGFPVDNSHILEWQLAHLRQALRTSLVDMDSYGAYPGRLEPVIPAAVASGLSQSYPRIFVEPRPNEPISTAPRQSIEIAQQYRLQQLYRQALQKQKLQVHNVLPTPPSSSSPQWSSHFSPYLTYCPTLSPELVGSAEHPDHVPTQKYRPGPHPSQYLRHDHDRHDTVNNFDTSTNISSTKAPRMAPNVSSAPPLGSSSCSSSTLAKYIKQLQALSPIANFSPLQPSSNASLAPLQSTDESVVYPFQSAYHLPIVRAPPSPESPQTLSRGSSYHNARSMAAPRPLQRRLSSVPEEDSALLEHTTSVSPPMRQSQATIDRSSSSQDGTTGHQIRYIEMPLVDVARKSALPDFESILGAPSTTLHHETSPVKVRLPVAKEHSIREPTSEYHEQNKEGHQHGHRKKHRYKKFKGPATANEQATTRGLVG